MPDEILPVMPVGRLGKDELKEFVLGLVDGRILTSAQVHDEGLVGMVFMPLLFGAFKLPAEHEHLIPPVLPEPVIDLPVGPDGPLALVLPEKPAPPAPPAVPDHLLRDVDWGRIAPSVLDPYQEELARHEAAVAEWEATVLRDHEEACRNAVLAHEAALAAHEEAVERWKAHVETLRRAHKEAVKAWEAEAKKVDARHREVMATWLRDLGVVWEYYDKAGPRGINGYPCFFSCHLMHREDWERARRAADKEHERRKQIDLDLDVQDETPGG